jgi:hypothetical protein
LSLSLFFAPLSCVFDPPGEVLSSNRRHNIHFTSTPTARAGAYLRVLAFHSLR